MLINVRLGTPGDDEGSRIAAVARPCGRLVVGIAIWTAWTVAWRLDDAWLLDVDAGFGQAEAGRDLQGALRGQVDGFAPSRTPIGRATDPELIVLLVGVTGDRPIGRVAVAERYEITCDEAAVCAGVFVDIVAGARVEITAGFRLCAQVDRGAVGESSGGHRPLHAPDVAAIELATGGTCARHAHRLHEIGGGEASRRAANDVGRASLVELPLLP